MSPLRGSRGRGGRLPRVSPGAINSSTLSGLGERFFSLDAFNLKNRNIRVILPFDKPACPVGLPKGRAAGS